MTNHRFNVGKVLLLIGTWVCSLSALAAPDARPVNDPSSVLLQTLFGLALVVGLIFLVALLAKKLNLTQLGVGKGMKVVAALNLSAREKVVLVELGEKQILLGVAPGNVNMLHVFDEPVITNVSRTEMPASANATSEFARKLNEFLKIGNKTQ